MRSMAANDLKHAGSMDSRLAILNQHRKVLPGPRLLHDLIAAPDDKTSAIEFLLADESVCRLSYGDFHLLSWTLTRQIQDISGFDSHSLIIPVVIPQSPELYITWRAVLQAGLCVCPVSPDTPLERFKYILKDVGAKLVLYDDSATRLIDDLVGGVRCLRVSLKALRHQRSNGRHSGHKPASPSKIDPDSPAYIMYTSGSTGLPKGVQVSHLSASQSLLAHNEHIPTFKRFLQFASPTFDVSIFEIFFPLHRGATLVSRSREFMLSDLPGTIRKLDADAAELTPTVAGTLLCTRAAAPCLKTLLTIGEMLTKRVIEEFGGNETKPSMLYAMYGPTEAAIHCTVAPLLPTDASPRSIGTPLSTATAIVLKDGASRAPLEIAPLNEEGELAIAGQLADGYLNRPEQTKDAFAILEGRGKIYRTGDRAICRSNGQLEMLGRMTAGQVKLRGQRVELGEVEEVALRMDGVTQAAAVVINDALRLYCYGHDRVRRDDISRICKSWLPPFMRPNDIVLQHTPLATLPSGKLDRKALEQEAANGFHVSNGHVNTFLSKEEQVIGAIFNDNLHRRLSRDDDLWAWGLNSLRAIKIASELRKHFATVNFATLLRCETIAELARAVREDATLCNGAHVNLIEDSNNDWKLVQTGAYENLEPSDLSAVDDLYPCTPIQIGMLTETLSQPHMNFNSITLRLKSGILFENFRDAFLCLAQRVEILRSGFVSTNQGSMPFVQVVWRQFQRAELGLLHPMQFAPDPNDATHIIVSIHHALYDGWAWDLIINDLNDILDHKPTVPRKPFNEVSRALRSHLPQAMSSDSLAYWKNLLLGKGNSPFPNLTASKPAKPKKSFVEIQLGVNYDQLHTTSTSLRVTGQTFLQACWAILLSAYTDSEDVIFGTVASGRHAAITGIDEAIGPCLATLATRLDLGRVQTLRDLLNYIQRQNLDSLTHYDTPLINVKKQAGLTTSDDLFDTLVVWQGSTVPLRGSALVQTVRSEDSLDYAAVVEVEPFDQGYRLKLTYDDSLVPEDQATKIASQLDEIFSIMTVDTDFAVKDVWRKASPKLVSIFNPGLRNFEHRSDLTESIERHAELDPQAVAIRFVADFDPTNRRLVAKDVSYGELWQQASAISTRLITEHKIRPDQLICILAPKSVELYVAVLAIVLAGAGYMCIDPNTPHSRTAQTLDQAKPALLLITNSAQINRTPCPQVNLHHLVKRPAWSRQVDIQRPLEHHLAYAVFTSGTTGVPKGVLMTRKNLASHINSLRSIYPHIPGKDSLLQACSPAFDVSVFEIFWTWHMGLTLVSARNDVLFRDLEGFIQTLNVTHLSMTPSVAALVNPKNVPVVKMLVTAGEPMNSKVFHQWAGRCLYQGYGPSETTNICNVRPQVQVGDAQNNVGPSFANTSIFICQRLSAEGALLNVAMTVKDFRPVAGGAVGEIWIGGDQVARGYIDPLLTAHSFLDHPEFGWLYRSGDMGRLLADGTLVVLGREDDQTKIRGQRMELGEISSALLKNDNTADAVSIVDRGSGASRLLAFVTLRKTAPAKSTRPRIVGLFDTLHEHLPAYMIPDAIAPVDAMPLTKQGKIDKKRLLDDFHAMSTADMADYWRVSDETAVFEPLSGSELSIAKALSETINVPIAGIGPTTSFYAVGLDSLSAIRLAHHLKNEGLPHLDVSVILKNSTVRALSKALSMNGHPIQSKEPTQWQHLMEAKEIATLQKQIRRTEMVIEKVMPCTSLQISMLAASHYGEGISYRNRLKFTVNGDIHNLKAAWKQVMQRQELLRTTFVERDDVDMPYVQVVLENTRLPWFESNHVSDTQDKINIQKWIKFEVEVCECGTQLMLDIHHALYDAEAIHLLLNEVESAYHSFEPSPAVHFDSYLQYTISMDKSAVQAFWHARLGGRSPTRLTQHVKRQARLGAHTMARISKVSSLHLAVIEQQARQQAVTTLAYLQAALARLLFHYLSTSSISFGNVFSGRSLPIDGVDRIIGPCFNTLPISARAERSTTNGGLVQALHQTNVDILPFQSSSLRELQRKYSPDGKPLFDVLLLLQQGQMELDDSIWRLEDEQGDMDFPFIFEVQSQGTNEPLKITLHSNTVVNAVLEEVLATFDELLTHTVRYPEALLSTAVPATKPAFLHTAPTSSSNLENGYMVQPNGVIEHFSELEQQIKDMMLSLSRNPNQKVTLKTTIFKLGLDSINAVQLASKLRAAGYRISSGDILEAPSLGDIAFTCAKAGSGVVKDEGQSAQINLGAFSSRYRANVAKAYAIDDSAIATVRPCTPLQCGILSQHVQSGGDLYYNTLKMKFHNSVAESRIRQAWQDATNKHEMLRTGFAECDDPECSFLMVTYADHHFSPPFIGPNDENWPVRRGRTKDTFIRPPWHLKIDQRASTVELGMLHALYDAQSLDTILADVANACIPGEVALSSPETPAIGETLASILGMTESNDSQQFWELEKNLMHPTKFPDLSIYTASGSGGSVTQRPLPRTLEAINAACANLECTLQAACQAAWSRLIGAYLGQDRVTFGIILSGRNFGDERDDAVFPCINTVPCTIQLNIETKSLLRSISSVNSGLLKHQQTPLTSIKRWQGLPDEPFNTVLVLQKFASRRPEDVPWDIVEEHAQAEFDVSIEIVPSEEENAVLIRMTYSERVLPEQASTTVLQQFEQLLLDVLGFENSNEQVQSQLAPVQDRLPSPVAFLHDFVEATASRQAQSPALEFVTGFDGNRPITQAWTYSDLTGKGNRIANLLIESGIKTGDLVATCFDKCPEASFSMLGVLKAGCAYVAIDPGAPVDRKNFILKDAGCRIVLTVTSRSADFEAIQEVHCIAVDDEAMFRNVSDQLPTLTRELNPQDTCYCLYTSGTTGTPKGCLISHESAVQAMLSFQRIFQGHWTSESRWLQFASFHFDVSVLEQYWSWSVGICMVTAPRDMMLEDLPTFLRQTKITHLDLTPSLARLISPGDVPSLCKGVFIVGGEQVSQDIIDIWGDAGCLYNFYGPSEVTIGCTVHPRVKKGTKPTNIGQLWDNVGAYVLRPGTEEAVMRGAIGELCLTGILVGKGYLNRPELTQEKFATLRSGVRVYRTGDLVRLLHDDSFDFLGRIDDQVKLRGQRLEIGEINQVIKSSVDRISGVATMVLKHPKGGKHHLVSFVTTARAKRSAQAKLIFDEDTAAMITSIRNHCVSKLPGYMVPSSFFRASNLPLSANNKVDNKGLKALYERLDGTQISQQAERQISLSEEEQHMFPVVAGVIAQRLGLPETSIQPSSRLFELGFDSISAIGLSRSLKAQGFDSINVQTVMKSSLVIDLLHYIGAASESEEQVANTKAAREHVRYFESRHRADIATALGVDAIEIENISPCTSLQEGMISKAVSADESDTTYFAEFVLRLGEEVSVDRIRYAWQKAQESFSILRTYFIPTEDGYAQAVLRPNIQRERQENDAGISEQLSNWVHGAKGFGAFRPWKLCFDEKNGTNKMRLLSFHGIYDGISLDLLLEAVAKFYTGAAGANTVRSSFYEVLPYGPLCMSSSAETFWKQSISHITKLDLAPADDTVDDKPLTSVTFGAEKPVGGLAELCRKLNVTLPAVFHAAWLLCLQQRYRVNPTLGVVVSGRTTSPSEAETIVGPMFNTLPSHIEVVSNTGCAAEDLIHACHKFNIEALPFQHTPLRHIAKWLGVDAKNGLFDSLFVFQRERIDAYEHDLWEVLPSVSQPDYPLNLEVEQRKDGRFAVTLVGKSEYLTQSDCEGIVETYFEFLTRFPGENIPLPDQFVKMSAQTRPATSVEREKTLIDHVDTNEVWTDTMRTIQQELAKLAATDIESIGLHRPTVFEIGLDSIDVMKLATRLKNAGIKVPIGAVMRAPTVAGIAAVAEQPSSILEQTQSHPPSDIITRQPAYRRIAAAHGINLDEIQLILPVTAMQEGLLLDYDKYYNITAFELSPGTDIALLESVWQSVSAEQPILRTSFVVVESDDESEAFLQVVRSSGTPVSRFEHDVDLDHVVATMRNQAKEHGLSTPTLKVMLLGSSDRKIMVMGMPHAAYDGWSIPLLHHAVRERYQEMRNGSSIGEGAARVQYTQHLEEVIALSRNNTAIDFWNRTIASTKQTLLQSTDTSSESEPRLTQLPSTISANDLQQFCKTVGITLQSLGLAAWFTYLARNLRQATVCFGLVLSGRTTDGSENLIFPTFNTVIFSMRVASGDTAEQLIRRAHRVAMDVTEHQHFPLKEILKLSRSNHGPGQLFNTLFTYQKAPGSGSEEAALYEELQLDTAFHNPPYAVNIELEVKDETVMWTLASQQGMFDGLQAQATLIDLDHILQNMVQHPDQRVFDEDEEHLFENKREGSTTPQPPRPATAELNTPFELNEVETAVRDTLAEVSQTDHSMISKSTNLFNLGLDSISTIKVASSLKLRGFKLPISKILEAQTLEKIAAAIEGYSLPDQKSATTGEIGHAASKSSLAALTKKHITLLQQSGLSKTEIETVLPSTAGQQYMLEVWRKSAGELFYPSFWFEVGGDVSETEFATAAEKLMETTPMLRTTFIRNETQTSADNENDGQILQVVLTPPAARSRRHLFPWTYHAQTQSQTSNLLVTLRIHHALYDAVSMDILVNQLNYLCSETSIVPQNNDFASFISDTTALSAEVKGRQRQFWINYLDPDGLEQQQHSRTQMSFTSPRLEHFNSRFMQIIDLRTRLRLEGVSFQALFFAVVGRVYHAQLLRHESKKDNASVEGKDTTTASSYDNNKSVLIGIYLSLRNLDIPDLPRLGGPTVNIVPLRVPISDGEDDEDGLWAAATQIQRDLAAIGKAEHCGVSLKEVWEWTGGKATVGCVVNFLADIGDSAGDEAAVAAAGAGAASPSVQDECHPGGKKSTERCVWHADEEVVKRIQTEESKIDLPPSPSPFATGNRSNTAASTNTTAEAQAIPRDEEDDEMPWYIPTVDIEAKLTTNVDGDRGRGGYLGVGVFGQESVLGGEVQMERWFEGIGELLGRASRPRLGGTEGPVMNAR